MINKVFNIGDIVRIRDNSGYEQYFHFGYNEIMREAAGKLAKIVELRNHDYTEHESAPNGEEYDGCRYRIVEYDPFGLSQASRSDSSLYDWSWCNPMLELADAQKPSDDIWND